MLDEEGVRDLKKVVIVVNFDAFPIRFKLGAKAQQNRGANKTQKQVQKAGAAL